MSPATIVYGTGDASPRNRAGNELLMVNPDWDPDMAGSFTPRRATGGGSSSKHKSRQVDDVDVSAYQRWIQDGPRSCVLKEYMVVFPVVRVRKEPTRTANVMRKLSCGLVVEAWDARDDEDQREWVRLKAGGWVRKMSLNRKTCPLLQEIVPAERLESAVSTLRGWAEKRGGDDDGGGGTADETVRESLKRVIAAAQSSLSLRNVVTYQQRLVRYAQTGTGHREAEEEEEEEEDDDDGPL